mgnify:CR=1 FL=1
MRNEIAAFLDGLVMLKATVNSNIGQDIFYLLMLVSLQIRSNNPVTCVLSADQM